MSRSDGSTADYYELPEGATQLQDLISHRNLNAQLGEIFRACYRFGMADHSDQLRDAKKILFYAKAEVERLEKLLAKAKVDLGIEVRGANRQFEPAQMIDDESPRAQAIGQNGNDGLHYDEGDNKPEWSDAPAWAKFLAKDHDGEWSWFQLKPFIDSNGNWQPQTDDEFWFECNPTAGNPTKSPESTLEARPCQ